MNIDAGFAALLTDSELIRYLENNRSELTDTPAETELLKRFEKMLDRAEANEAYFEEKHEILECVESYELTNPKTLEVVLKAANQIIQTIERK